ncbi:hypothetical protein MS3_00010000 [Schistosoma haematobium]|uniref:Egg protein CP391S-like protein n=1 Tax=Schistosoma haematobium TaxID=6185 RepID=A0A922S4I1_SCHHA|nr:hypothetical protein MS3_00010000 [Schistosoma haematobium]KAH9593552.1 hypothetical protein MS3_00010000 [Schistosoma haematobium]
MMRFNSPYNLFIRISMMLNLFSVFCNCDEICKQPEWNNFTKVIFVNESYRYSHNYHYSQTISLNQPYPIVNGSFKIFKEDKIVEPQFPLKFFESEFTEFKTWYRGVLSIFENKKPIGQISNVLESYGSRYLLNEKGLIAVKWSPEGKDKENTPIVTNLLYPNGKISIYYENILLELSENKSVLGIRRIFQCETGPIDHRISVPVEWIQNGTLVEYEVIGTICPKHNSSEACQQATTPNVKCIWCEKWNTCIDSNHQNHHFFKVNDCHYKGPDVNDLTTSTPINHKETTLRNTTFEITEESRQNKSLWYLYIVIPSVVFVFAACISCVIWRWLHIRRRSSE